MRGVQSEILVLRLEVLGTPLALPSLLSSSGNSGLRAQMIDSSVIPEKCKDCLLLLLLLLLLLSCYLLHHLEYVDTRVTLIRKRGRSPIIFIILEKENISIKRTLPDIFFS